MQDYRTLRTGQRKNRAILEKLKNDDNLKTLPLQQVKRNELISRQAGASLHVEKRSFV
jgi:hypothetical protein